MSRRKIFDIETDDLLVGCTKMWIIHFLDAARDSSQTRQFLIGDMGWIKYIEEEVDEMIGHNVAGFDVQALAKLFGYELPARIKLTDTMIMSKKQDYKRFGNAGHSLETWGEFLGKPKQEHEDWSQLTPEMIRRCETDCELNKEVYWFLQDELKRLLFNEKEKTGKARFVTGLHAEHSAARWCGEAERRGWPFDIKAGSLLEEQLSDVVNEANRELSKKLGTKTVAVDLVKGVVEPKSPRWNANGFYSKYTAEYFGIEPESGYPGEERLVEGPYCRVEFVPLSLSSVSDVKIFLERNGWQPTEWNTKRDPVTNKTIQTSPKITEESLEFLGGDGKLYTKFAVAKSRLAILKTWLENVDSNGRLHGGCIPIGTPSMRATHNIIVNVPSTDQPWGKEMRSLFITSPGMKLIGCDSAGNQARGLAHYLGDPGFIDTLLNGDIHQFNADVLTKILNEMGLDVVVTRAQAKRILYAFLFGARGAKLWSYIFGVLDEKRGNKLKTGFIRAVPGFESLVTSLLKIYGATSKGGSGYIRGIDYTKIYVDSPHKLLVYLLQSVEKATCSAAVHYIRADLANAGIYFEPLIFMHDEVQFQVAEDHADAAAEIGKQAFRKGARMFGIEIMDGEAKIGNNWYETH